MAIGSTLGLAAAVAGPIIGGIMGGGGGGGGNVAGNANWANSTAQNNALAARRATAPYTHAGYAATKEVLNLLGLGTLNPMSVGEGSYGDTSLNETDRPGQQAAALNRFQASPDYNFRVGEGVKALDRSAAARGRLMSGAQDKAVTQFGQDIGKEEYANYFNRLMGLSGQGAGSANSTNATATGAANVGTGAIASTVGAQTQLAGIDAMNKRYLGDSIGNAFSNAAGFAIAKKWV